MPENEGVDGQPALTNKKRVLTFVSGTKAYISSSLNANPDMASQWNDKAEADVTINGDDMVWTALRENADGSTVQQGMKWLRVE